MIRANIIQVYKINEKYENIYGKSQIHGGEICSSGVIINPLREQAAVYVAFYMYKIVRITEERGRGRGVGEGRRGGYGSAGTMRASSRKERKSSEKAE